MIDPDALAQFVGSYPERSVGFAHGLAHHPLLTQPRLTLLAGTLPKENIRLFPEEAGAMGPALLVQTLTTQSHAIQMDLPPGTDPEYQSLLDDLIRPAHLLLQAAGEKSTHTFAAVEMMGPRSVPTTRLCTAHTLLMQIRGGLSARLTNPTALSADQLALVEEAYTDKSRLLPEDVATEEGSSEDLYEDRALFIPAGTILSLTPGDMLGVTLWLRWESVESRKLSDAYRLHHLWRQKGKHANAPQAGLKTSLKSRYYQWRYARET